MPTKLHLNKIEVGPCAYLDKEPIPLTHLPVSFYIFIYLFRTRGIPVKPTRKKSKNVTIDFGSTLAVQFASMSLSPLSTLASLKEDGFHG
jgi:hypothetical protein